MGQENEKTKKSNNLFAYGNNDKRDRCDKFNG